MSPDLWTDFGVQIGSLRQWVKMTDCVMIDPNVAADLMESTGTAEFPAKLLEVAHAVSGVEEVFAYQVDDLGKPTVLASSSGLQNVADRTASYSNRFYRIDPANNLRLASSPGSSFMRRVLASEIDSLDYRRICFERPRFVEKICYGWRGESQTQILSFYTRRQNAGEMEQLNSLAQVALAILVRAARSPGPEAQVEQRLRRSFPQLTDRERNVCCRTISGSNARQIAEELGISQSSVLTYRQRTYRKLGIAKASDLMPFLLN